MESGEGVRVGSGGYWESRRTDVQRPCGIAVSQDSGTAEGRPGCRTEQERKESVDELEAVVGRSARARSWRDSGTLRKSFGG